MLGLRLVLKQPRLGALGTLEGARAPGPVCHVALALALPCGAPGSGARGTVALVDMLSPAVRCGARPGTWGGPSPAHLLPQPSVH